MPKAERDPFRITIITTSINEGKGSMGGYAILLQYALEAVSREKTDIRIIALGPSRKFLACMPRVLRTPAYHCWLVIKAMQVKNIKADILHLTDGSYAHVLRWLPSSLPKVVTAHDIIPLLQARKIFPIAPPGIISRWLIQKSIRGLEKAAAVISVSSNTRGDLIKFSSLSPKKITVVPSAVPRSIMVLRHELDSAPWSWRRNSPAAYILHVGNDGFYKNRRGVLRIFKLIREKIDIRLIMAGPPPSETLSKLLDSLGLREFVKFVIHPDNKTLVEHYSRAALFLFPSLYEGYGWPPLEAMALQCPVVCSNRASLPEVVGEAALTADPEDEVLMADLCISVLQDESLATGLINKGLVWVEQFRVEDMGRQILDVYAKVIGQGIKENPGNAREITKGPCL